MIGEKDIITPFVETKVYCKNECFKAMHYAGLIKKLKQLNLSFSNSINLSGFQFIKECEFFPNLIELNLESLLIFDKHTSQMC